MGTPAAPALMAAAEGKWHGEGSGIEGTEESQDEVQHGGWGREGSLMTSPGSAVYLLPFTLLR